ncbi:tape measure protein [Gordonia phage Nyceirae]|uniref:Tape measure protein n=1 Tax=Gordonia phage Nyceirae TaxID=1887651 RepID=A0A1C9EHW6_9CAUD|nr:tail length tape measure protein [Gordonia phage Nyceirae]AON97384.1 tape measure protein [Gordonia phage Nyceirae]
MAGGIIEIDVVLNDRDLTRRLDRAAQMARRAATGITAAFGAAGLVAGLKQVVTVGRDFDLVMNTIRGTSGATAQEMAAISDKARQLGNDIALPATSAVDAATAMLELSKGGLTVKASMDAARGSLALAAAAQIDAGKAAEIQANAINTFRLKATDAEHVADVLANTANKSSAGMTDIADALQQSGSVAAQFNMTLDQTAGALGVIANNGIKGSDAGTLLKSTLLALQDTGKPATEAMKTLGIVTYDAEGRFVGLGKILEQVNTASKNLTEEQFNQATSILFGSDAMRLAGIAAKENADSFRNMTDAVGQAGGASRLAAEMNKGLPGALERVKNAAETTQLAIYELLRGPLTDLANFGADKLTGVADWIGDQEVDGAKLRALADALRPVGMELREIGIDAADVAKGTTEAGGAVSMLGDGAKIAGEGALAGLQPLLGVIGGVASGFASLPTPVQTAALAMGAFALARGRMNRSLAQAGERDAAQRTRWQNMALASRQFNQEMRTQARLARMQGTELTRAQRIMAGYNTSTVGSVASMRNFTTQVGAARAGAAAAGTPIGRLAASMQVLGQTRTDGIGRIASAFTNAATAAGGYSRAAGIAAGSATALRVGAGAVFNAVGGLSGLLFGGATLALAMYSSNQRKAAQAAAEHKQIVDGLVGSINAQTGALNAAGVAQVQQSLADMKYGDKKTNPYDTLEANKQLAISADTFTNAAAGQRDAIDQVNQSLDNQTSKSIQASDFWRLHGESYQEVGVSVQEFTAAVRGNEKAQDEVERKLERGGIKNWANTWRDAREDLDGAGQSAVQLGQQMGQANDSLTDAQKAAQQQAEALRKVTPEARTLAESMQVLSDNTASASDKASALKTALDALSGGAEGVDAARGQGLAEVEKLPALWEAASAAAGGYAGIIDQSTGRISVNSDATRELSASVTRVKDSMNTAASAAYQFAIENGQSQEQARQAAVVASQGIYDSFMHTAEGARRAGVDVDGLMSAMRVLPPQKLVEFISLGADTTRQEIFLVREELNRVPPGHTVTMSTLSKQAQDDIRQTGAMVKELPDGRVEITALTDGARARIDELLKPESKTVTVNWAPGYGGGVGAGWAATAPAQPRALGGPVGYAVGGGIGPDGAIRGPGTGTSDSISTFAPAGGHVFTARETEAAGGHEGLRARLAAMSRPGRGRAAAGAMQAVKLSNGEHYASPDEVAAAGGHEAIFGLRRMLKSVQRFSLGGLVRSEQVAHANDGLPYITGARDCSMWVSWMVQAAKGQPLGRLFTTHTLIGGQTAGLVPGASPGDLLTVGTSSEHMAATVMTANGPVNTESGGNSSPSQVRWGRGAAGAFDPQFTHRFHLPLNLINPIPQKELTPGNSASPYIPDSLANRRDQDSIRNEGDGESRQYIEPPKPPKLEDVSAEAAKIATRGLLETFGLENSILADPGQSTIGQALQIGANTDRYRREQSMSPTENGEGGTGVELSDEEKLRIKQDYERERFPRDQKYKEDQAAIRKQYPGDGNKGVRDQKLFELKQRRDTEELPYKQEYQSRLKGSSTTGGETDGDPNSTDGGGGSTVDGTGWGTRVQPQTPTDPYLMVDSAPYNPVFGAAQWGKEIAAALQIAGLSQTFKQQMVGQGDIESKGDPRAIGPSSPDGTPQGWMQVKPGTFASMRDSKLPDDPFNVLANGVAALNWTKERWGDPNGANWPTTAGYKDGGLHPMRGDKASVVPPNTWRVVGDRAIADEFFIPDTDDPQHVAIGAEWARRRGMQLVQLHADGGISARARGGQAAMATALAEPRTEEYHTHEGPRNYNYSGPAEDARGYFGAARRHDRIDGQGVGITRIGRKGSNR